MALLITSRDIRVPVKTVAHRRLRLHIQATAQGLFDFIHCFRCQLMHELAHMAVHMANRDGFRVGATGEHHVDGLMIV